MDFREPAAGRPWGWAIMHRISEPAHRLPLSPFVLEGRVPRINIRGLYVICIVSHMSGICER